MKKLIAFCVSISFIAISGAMLLKFTHIKRWNDPALLENVEAFAKKVCIYCQKQVCPSWCIGNGGGNDDDGGDDGSGGSQPTKYSYKTTTTFGEPFYDHLFGPVGKGLGGADQAVIFIYERTDCVGLGYVGCQFDFKHIDTEYDYCAPCQCD